MILVGRAKKDILIRAKAIRSAFGKIATDDLRLELFEKQQGLCALGGKPLPSAESIWTQIDHTVPVLFFAEIRCYTMKQACTEANKKTNLQLVCISYGVRKSKLGLRRKSYCVRLHHEGNRT
jgi:hypothetical protein